MGRGWRNAHERGEPTLHLLGRWCRYRVPVVRIDAPLQLRDRVAEAVEGLTVETVFGPPGTDERELLIARDIVTGHGGLLTIDHTRAREVTPTRGVASLLRVRLGCYSKRSSFGMNRAIRSLFTSFKIFSRSGVRSSE